MSSQTKPYLVRAIFEENRDFFNPSILGKPNFTQKMGYRVSELVFKYLVLRGWMQAYPLTVAVLVVLAFILAFVSQIFGVFNATLINYAYMFIMLLVLPFLAYFLDVYQAMQLRRGMNLAVRDKSYPRLKRGEARQKNQGKFEWVPTNLAILNAVMHGQKKQLSHGELARIAGVDRQTAASAVRKLLNSGLIYKDNEIYCFSGVEFEVSVRKGKKTEARQLGEDEKKRLKYLFELLCFVAL